MALTDTITTERVERKLEKIESGLRQHEKSIQAMSNNKPEDAREPFTRLLEDKFGTFNKSFAELQQFWRKPGTEEEEELVAESGKILGSESGM